MEDPLQGLVDGISKWKKDTIYIEQPHFSHQPPGSWGAGPISTKPKPESGIAWILDQQKSEHIPLKTHHLL